MPDPTPDRSVPRAHPATRWSGSRSVARLGLLLAVACGVVVPATGCARRGAASQQDERPTTLRVRNQNFLDMNVFVVRGGQPIRLGTVSGNSTQVLRIPAYLLAGVTPLRFVADPIGRSRGPVSEEIVVSPGDQVELMVPPG
jgi:hypothetical protein